MIVIEALKLNCFKPVRVPKNLDYYARFGEYNPSAGQFTGAEDTTPVAQSKLDSIRQTDSDFKDFIPPVEQH